MRVCAEVVGTTRCIHFKWALSLSLSALCSATTGKLRSEKERGKLCARWKSVLFCLAGSPVVLHANNPHCKLQYTPLLMRRKYDLNISRFRFGFVLLSLLVLQPRFLFFHSWSRFHSPVFSLVFNFYTNYDMCARAKSMLYAFHFCNLFFDDLFHSLGSVLALY